MTICYIGMYTLDGTLFLWIHFHLVQNVYHEAGKWSPGFCRLSPLQIPSTSIGKNLEKKLSQSSHFCRKTVFVFF